MNHELRITPPTRFTRLRRRAAADGGPETGRILAQGVQLALDTVHAFSIGGSELLLDLGTGTGLALHDIANDEAVPEPLNEVETRLVLLDWTRHRMPVMTPTAAWDLEVAALVSEVDRPAWHRDVATRTVRAIDHVLSSRVDLPDGVHRLLARARHRLDGRGELDGRLWAELLAGLATGFAAHAPVADLSLAPLLATVAGAAEPEWDRLPWFALDVREHAVRSTIASAVWTASIATQPRRSPHSPEHVSARLVDDETGEVLDVVELPWTDGLYAGRGQVPLGAEHRRLRVDLAHQQTLRARTSEEHRWALRQQAGFRTLLFERFATVDDGWAPWASAHRAATSFGSPALSRRGPFVAERLLRPEQLSSSRPDDGRRVTRGRRRPALPRTRFSPEEGSR